MEQHDTFVLVRWTGDKDFSWSILPREEVFTTDNEELSTRMTCKAKWRSSQLDAEVWHWMVRQLDLYMCIT